MSFSLTLDSIFGFRIIGEESYSAGQEKRFLLDDDPTWIIDPLDGVSSN
jgi:fructose-1,6-bisphosphatase/inositol monophosphatase family enzyme